MTIIGGLTLASPQATLATELLSNGDFSMGTTGWTGFDGSNNSVAPSDATVLPGYADIALIGQVNASGTSSIYQEFTALADPHWLTISFAYGFAGFVAPGMLDLLRSFVQIDGFGTVDLLSISSGSNTFAMNDTVTMMFAVSGADLTSPNARITFALDENAGTSSGDSRAGIDDVSVQAFLHPISEPGTLALLGLGLAGLGALRRRRRT